jgi:hypothetical protein
MLPDVSLMDHPAGAPLLALCVALLWAVMLRRGRWAALALPLGALLGFAWVMGGFSASPRQLPERLPLLALGALLLAVPLAVGLRGWAAGALVLLGGAATGWWMAGAPLTEADLRRVIPVLVLLGLTVPLLHRAAAAPWRATVAAVAMAAGLWLAGTPGPWLLLALVLLGAGLPLFFLGQSLPAAALLPFVMLMAAVLAGGLLMRGAPADWMAALAPLGALLLGAAPAGRRGAWQAPVLLMAAALPGLALAWLLR